MRSGAGHVLPAKEPGGGRMALIEFDAVTHDYPVSRGTRTVLRDVTVRLYEPRIALIGANGSAKSTLCTSGQDRPIGQSCTAARRRWPSGQVPGAVVLRAQRRSPRCGPCS